MRAKASLLAALGAQASDNGAPGCSCATADTYDFTAVQGLDPCGPDELRTNHLLPDLTPMCITTPNYGLDGCQTYDMDEATCTGANPPTWCSQAWCFVVPMQCTKSQFESFYFPELADQGLVYSYETCGVEAGDAFQRWAASAAMNAPELAGVIEGYVDRIGQKIEEAFIDIESDEAHMSTCEYTDSCFCTNCRIQDGWGEYEVDFGDVSIVHPRHLVGLEDSPEARKGQCLASVLEYEFLRIKNREYTDPTRVAYIMYANQGDGMFFEWPAIQWCTQTYDPRFRSWYVESVTGPKTVIILADRSSSMTQPAGSPRSASALRAVEGLLGTFTSMDWVCLIAFSGGIQIGDVNEDLDGTHVLAPMTDGAGGSPDNKKKMLDFATRSIGNPLGDTNFYKAFRTAFDMLRLSIQKGKHSQCNTMILFLTDGIDKSGKDIVEEVALMQNEDPPLKVPIFTYAFGALAANLGLASDAGADDPALAQIPHKLACQNWGIAYDIEDPTDSTASSVADAMTDYYQYFSAGLDQDHPSFGKVRWVEWKDLATGALQLSGCKPIYDERARSAGEVQLNGVICIDINMLVDLHELQFERGGWPQLQQQIDEANQQCDHVSYENDIVKLQELRNTAKSRGFGYVCKPCDFTKEPCPVPSSAADDPQANGEKDSDSDAVEDSHAAILAASVLFFVNQ
jgi:hypothetical protein